MQVFAFYPDLSRRRFISRVTYRTTLCCFICAARFRAGMFSQDDRRRFPLLSLITWIPAC